ncbi:MAG: MFS transporter [Coriobacteriales bacterium]|jgi:MFS family permease|nr:MFS transporter [Coriobacteriales bacterium]
MSEGKSFSVSDVIDSFGISKFTWIMFCFLGLAMIFDGYDFMIVNVTNTFAARTFWPDNAAPGALMGSLTTWSLLGMVLGGAVGGILSDKFGRKVTLTLAVLFYGVFTLPQAFAPNYEFFAAFRFIAGFGIGSCIPVVTTTFSESMPSKNRGVFITFGMAFMVAGWVLASVIGKPINESTAAIIPGLTEQVTYLTPQIDPATGKAVLDASGSAVIIQKTMFANWRVCYLIGAIPILYGLFLLFFMKETPAWYVSKGRLKDAANRLAQIEKSARGTVTERDPNLLIIPPKPAKSSPDTLFSKKYIVATCAIWSCYFIGQFCVYGMNTWLPNWFTGIGYSSADAETLRMFNNIAAILSNVSVGFVSDIVGRKRNLAFSWLFAIVAIIICSLFVVKDQFVLCLFLMLLFGFALNYAITAVQPIMPESYPTQLRNTGVAWCQAFARFGGAASPIVLGAIATSGLFGPAASPNWNQLVLVLIVPLAVAFVCTLLFVRREAKGKSMDQVQTEIETT